MGVMLPFAFYSIVIVSFLGSPNTIYYKASSHLWAHIAFISSWTTTVFFWRTPTTSLQWHLLAIHLLWSCCVSSAPRTILTLCWSSPCPPKMCPKPPVLPHSLLPSSSDSVHAGQLHFILRLLGEGSCSVGRCDFHTGSRNTRWNIPDILTSFSNKEGLPVKRLMEACFLLSWLLVLWVDTLTDPRKLKA